MAVLASLAGLLFGNATWVVPLLMVLGPAVAGVLTFVALTSFGLSTRLRLWAGVAYALNPPMLAAISQGRWSTVLVAILLPLLALSGARVCGLGRHDPSVRAAAVAAIVFTVVTAAAPVMWFPLALLSALAAWRLVDSRGPRLRLLAVAVAPVVLLASWIPQVFDDPAVLLLESGVPLAADDQPPWQVLLLNPGGLTSVPLFLGVGLLFAGIAAVVRAADVRAVRLAWMAAAVGLGWALVVDSVTVKPQFSALPVAPWAGTPLVLAVAGLVVAAAVAARSSRHRLRRRALSWRQPVVALVALTAVLSPLLTGFWWVSRGAGEPIDRGVANPLPDFVRAQSELPAQIRTLVLEPQDGRLAYTLLRQRDTQFGDVEIAPPAARLADLDEVVADLASGRGSAPVDRLVQYAVQYILAVPPVDPALETALDSAPGLLRVANPGESSLWRIERETGRLRLVAADGSVIVLPSDPVDTDSPIPAGDGSRLLEVAELEDGGWSASESGRELSPRTVAGWAQGFEVSAADGDVHVIHKDPVRTGAFIVQLVALVIVIVMALPSRRRDEKAQV
jgi:hypothetical protein